MRVGYEIILKVLIILPILDNETCAWRLCSPLLEVTQEGHWPDSSDYSNTTTVHDFSSPGPITLVGEG